jgi:hypothetical protein
MTDGSKYFGGHSLEAASVCSRSDAGGSSGCGEPYVALLLLL